MVAKARTLKSAAREKVLAKYHRRGNNRSNIWLYYSPKTHVEWVLASDLEFDHAVLLEASPDAEVSPHSCKSSARMSSLLR